MGELGALGRRTWGWATRRLGWGRPGWGRPVRRGRPGRGRRLLERLFGSVLLVAVASVLVASASPVAGAIVGPEQPPDATSTVGEPGTVAQVAENDTAGASGEEPRDSDAIELVSIGNVTTIGGDDTAYLWTEGVQTAEIRIRSPAGFDYDSYVVCLSVEARQSDRSQRTCRRVVAGDEPQVLALNWTGEEPGARQLVVTLTGGADVDGEVVGRENESVHLMAPDGDVDSDKLSNQRELAIGTNLTDTDTDDDGLLDGAEVTEYGTDPLTADSDGDGLRDALEIQQGTDPLDEDTDGDGAPDPVEVDGPTDPTLADTDWDGVDDGTELDLGTDPTVADTDGDGLADGLELKLATEPTDADTDGDLLSDGTERRLGTDPTSAASPVVGAGVVFGFLLGVVWVWRRRRTPAGATGQAVRNPSNPETPAGSAEAAATGNDEDGPLTDRDRIRQLLREADGRLKQARIVEQTAWSKAKVSRVLSGMEEDDEISKIRIGRENLICLKGQEPDLARPSM